MSEPPLKKQRTILDFITNSEGIKQTRSRTAAVPMASGSGADSKGLAGKCEWSDPSDDCDQDDPEQDAQGSGLVDSPRIPTKKPSQVKDGSNAWKGIPLRTLDKLVDTAAHMGPLKPTENHRVLFKTPYQYDEKLKKPPATFPSYLDKWDQWHVRMPCSNQNEYPGIDKNNKPIVRRRWDMIQEALLGDIPGPYELEERILSYNSRYMGKWSFDNLNKFFQVSVTREERMDFFNTTLKKMATLALQLPHLCTTPIPLLKAGKSFSITLSQQQIGCLLANAFFCTFPRRNAKNKAAEFRSYPNINFNTLFTGQPSAVKFEKIKCLIHYFRRFFKHTPCGTVTFTRQVIDPMPEWEKDDTPLKGLHVSSEGTIEDDGEGLLQVDFANMFLGGGVLGQGCVQEEIRFLICPEMLVTRLFTECLRGNECLIMTGCERFSNYEGYASSFEWKENYVDKTPRDVWGRIMCEVVAIDALVIYDYKSQFKAFQVKRELGKAYCGFRPTDNKLTTLPAVCTGNWGCGAFGGDKQLKALVQLMAAAKAGRDLCYFTFDDEKIRDEIYEMHRFLTSDNLLTIGDLLKLIEQYRKNVLLKCGRRKPDVRLYEYIRRVFDGSLEDTDEDSNHGLELQPVGDHKAPQTYDSQSLEFGSEELLDDDDDQVKKEKKLKREDSADYKANTP